MVVVVVGGKLLLLLLLLFFFKIIIIIFIMKNECHSNITADRLQGCGCCPGGNVLHHVKGRGNCPGGGNVRGEHVRGNMPRRNVRIPLRRRHCFCLVRRRFRPVFRPVPDIFISLRNNTERIPMKFAAANHCHEQIKLLHFGRNWNRNRKF